MKETGRGTFTKRWPGSTVNLRPTVDNSLLVGRLHWCMSPYRRSHKYSTLAVYNYSAKGRSLACLWTPCKDHWICLLSRIAQQMSILSQTKWRQNSKPFIN